MSDIKTKAIGLLYKLATDPSTRQTWVSDPTWNDYFDDGDSNVQDTLNFIGANLDGGIPDRIKQISKENWQVVSDSMTPTFYSGFFENTPNQSNAYGNEIDISDPKLAVFLAELAFNPSVRSDFINRPKEYMEENDILSGDSDGSELSAELKDNFVVFGNAVKDGDNGSAKSIFENKLLPNFPAQYLKEQTLIW